MRRYARSKSDPPDGRQDMTTFAVITEPGHLPKIGTRESPTLDFKAQVSVRDGRADLFESAKDVAAMASAYGGVLLVGACETSSTGELTHWKKLSLSEAQSVARTYDESARDRCRPVPVRDPRPVEHPEGGYVVAVNVFPVLDQPVGVRVRGDSSDGYGDAAWVFPVRLSTHTTFYQPEQLAMLMNPVVRRAAILLEGIPPEARESVFFHWVGHFDTYQRPMMTKTELRVLGVDLAANVLRAQRGADPEMRIPLDEVVTVWERLPGRWSVRVIGAFPIEGSGPRYESRPAM